MDITAGEKSVFARQLSDFSVILLVNARKMPHFQPLNYREVAIHVVAWLGYINLQVLAVDQFEHQYIDHLLIALSELPAQLLFTYTTLYWLIPAYLLTLQYGKFWLLTVLLLAVCGVLYWQGYYYLFLALFDPGQLDQENPWDLHRLILSAFYMLCTSGLLIAFHMIRYGFRQQQLNQQLVIANQAVELKSLKDQINPHFLFNTLNNLYGLTSSNPEKAGEVVVRLAQLMQYMLYEGSLAKVPLRKEIDYLQNYLALERIRYGEGLQLSFQISGVTDQLLIAPLLLLPFVENAFKHGLSRQLGDAWLQIQLTVTHTELIFKVENSKPEFTGPATSPGIGLPNVAKRLQLMYPDRHRLRQLNGVDSFLSTLTIGLTPADYYPIKDHENQVFTSR
ncbi:hypothetical protein GO755_31275 [Spirosoma sp. HMF4905]|uniref:Signal transduction histidine kinase internal region domain-containing protein n=1 Tax=Spirosoma arboris TaxID=2682092 RepID=A0A7K1SL60_9BACT|nr:sensor histidine kinase [Spirosoma arboris]MVM34552.1 hypothetical protein [Spirosoma arboris]